MSVNKVILLGNVGKDPDVRYPAQGQVMATMPLATSDRAYTNANGTQIPERTEWHNLVMWGRNAEIAEKYIRKGTRLYVEGKLRTRNWEDRNKIKRYITEVYVENFEMLGGGQRAESTTAATQQPTTQPAQNANITPASNENLPF